MAVIPHRERRAPSVLPQRRFELDALEGLLADEPGVVTGLDHVSVARCEFDLCAVLMSDARSFGHESARKRECRYGLSR